MFLILLPSGSNRKNSERLRLGYDDLWGKLSGEDALRNLTQEAVLQRKTSPRRTCLHISLSFSLSRPWLKSKSVYLFQKPPPFPELHYNRGKALSLWPRLAKKAALTLAGSEPRSRGVQFRHQPVLYELSFTIFLWLVRSNRRSCDLVLAEPNWSRHALVFLLLASS